jgi:hypothetical protein
MKRTLLLLVFIITVNIAFAQFHETIIEVKDNRKLGLSTTSCNSPANGQKPGDVEVEKTLVKNHEKGKHDTLECYKVHFYKIFGDQLKNYEITLMWKGEYGQASYYWINDTSVSVTMVNSKTNKIRMMTLSQAGSTIRLENMDNEDK